jgi:hypothetical protein
LSAAPPLFSAAKTGDYFVVTLCSLVDADGAPVTDLEPLVKKPDKTATGAEYYVNIPAAPEGQPKPFGGFINAWPGAAVPGAELEVELVLGGYAGISGSHVVAQAFTTTDPNGHAAFYVGAGSHPENVGVRVRIASNPVNTWFTPTVDSPSVFFGPGTISDLDPQQEPYTLVLPLQSRLAAAGINLKAITTKLAQKTQKRSASGPIPFWMPNHLLPPIKPKP